MKLRESPILQPEFKHAKIGTKRTLICYQKPMKRIHDQELKA